MSSFEPWSYRSGSGFSDQSSLDGYKVLAPDGEVGKVEDASYPPSAAALVVDTGLGPFGQHVLLPAGVVECINHHTKEITVDVSDADIKAAPAVRGRQPSGPGLPRPGGRALRPRARGPQRLNGRTPRDGPGVWGPESRVRPCSAHVCRGVPVCQGVMSSFG